MLKTTEKFRDELRESHSRRRYSATDSAVFCSLLDDIDTLLAEVERLRGLLREVEFCVKVPIGNFPDDEQVCPICVGTKHRPGCKLAAALTGGIGDGN